MYEMIVKKYIIRYCVSISQKGLVTVVFTAEKKCVLIFSMYVSWMEETQTR